MSDLLDAAKTAASQIPEQEFMDFRTWLVQEEAPRREREAAVEQGRAEERQTIVEQIAETAPELVAPVDSTEPRTWAPWHPLQAETHFRYGDRAIGSDGQIYISQVDPEEGKKLNVWDPCAPGIAGDARYWIPEPPAEPGDADAQEPVSEPDGTLERPIPWAAGINFTKGQYTVLDGQVYLIVQSFTSYAHQPPSGPGLTALYKPVQP